MKPGTEFVGQVRYTGGGADVNSVSNLDGSLIISPTTGNVVVSINIGHANTWTALQTFNGGISVSGRLPVTVYGTDNRKGLTTTDTVSISVYTVNVANAMYKLTGRLFATAGTTISASYVIKWTEGGVAISKTLTVSAIDTDADLSSILIQPDQNTTVTAQVTAISGTGTTINVGTSVEGITV